MRMEKVFLRTWKLGSVYRKYTGGQLGVLLASYIF